MSRTALAAATLLGLIVSAASQAAAVFPTTLASDGAVTAPNIDPNLIDPWGLTHNDAGPFYVANKRTGLATSYRNEGQPHSDPIVIPPEQSDTSPPSSPTGAAANETSDFVITNDQIHAPAAFLFATGNGTISGWNPSVNSRQAIIAIDNSATRTVYTGLAIDRGSTGNYLLAANFRAGLVEVYDGRFHLVTAFRDIGMGTAIPPIPATFSPFNVAVLDGHIYVTYAEANAARRDSVSKPGAGFVDEVRIDGKLIRRIASRGLLNAPWGLALAPAYWTRYAGALLVGNAGNGWIAAYDPKTGQTLGYLRRPGGTRLTIPALHGLIAGNNGGGGAKSQIYFVSGPGHGKHGVFGTLTYLP